MTRFLLVQPPIPQQNFGRQTGNVPLAGALLKQAAARAGVFSVDLLPEEPASYLGDAALLDWIRTCSPDVIGFSVYAWNLGRVLYFMDRLKRERNVRVILGGPEVTPDNRRVLESGADFLVYGDGEAVFQRLATDAGFWELKQARQPADDWFHTSRSPYLEGLLDPGIERMVLVETQRGCPYRCGYCYYPKARDRVALKDASVVLETIEWAIKNDIPEMYLLDPSLNARPGLGDLMESIARLNGDRRASLVSEIRAEAVDRTLAERFQRAGFSWFEIGLQTIHPEPSRIMSRRLDLKGFLKGVENLKKCDILPRVDLIAGLPGDDLAGFVQSAAYVADHQLADDVQVFPLSVLPGTDFRRRSRELGLVYDPDPPYVVRETQGFSSDQIIMAYDYAEYRFETALHPWPDPDASFEINGGKEPGPDIEVRIGGRPYVWKIVLNEPRPLADLPALAGRLTHPYQIITTPNYNDWGFLAQFLDITTSANPFIPLEIVFLDPSRPPDPEALLAACRLHRPHFLDVEHRYMFPDPGNRAVLFTLVSTKKRLWFQGPMRRQLFWWKNRRPPELSDLEKLSPFDGVLADGFTSDAQTHDWQDRMSPHAEDVTALTFRPVRLQRRWLEITQADQYHFGVWPD